MNETKYKQTPIGKIPKDWEVVKINQISEVRRGASPRPIGDPKYFSDKGRGWVRISDVTSTYKYLRKTSQYLSKIGERKSVEVNPGDLIMSICATIGKPIIVDMKACIHDGFVVFRNLSSGVNIEFLFYVLQRNELKFINMKQIGTQGNLNTTLVGKTYVPLPPLPEQKAIAKVLSTVDEAIQKVDLIIEKTERLKKGLMQELLTKGIGHKEFKYSKELGCEIPKEWKVVNLGDTIKEIKNGFASGKRDENGIVQIRMNNVTTDGRLIFDSYLKVPVPDDIDNWILERGDFLFNNTNSYDLVGKSTIFNGAPFPCTFSNHFTRIRFRKELILPELVLYHFLILWRKGYFKSVAIRHVGQSAVHTKYLLKIKIPLPPLSEQQKIAEILGTVDKKLELERKRKEKLERIKKGLMNDLLTGKKRVEVEKVLSG